MAHYDEVEIEDMDWNDELNAFTYSCPCGDLFQITMVRNTKHVLGSQPLPLASCSAVGGSSCAVQVAVLPTDKVDEQRLGQQRAWRHMVAVCSACTQKP